MESEDDVTYLARRMKEAQQLPEKYAKKLKKMEIQLKHNVLPQHKIETSAGSRPPTHKQIESFENIVPIKRGMYNSVEDQIICHNWKSFCKLHGWKKKLLHPFLLLREDSKTHIRSKKQRRKFVQFLADGLPNRTLYSVYHRFRNLYNSHLQRRYQPHEDIMILDHLENNPHLNEKRKYVDLAKVLCRTRGSIWRRYRLLKRKRDKLKENI